jgi:hypothetical protein
MESLEFVAGDFSRWHSRYIKCFAAANVKIAKMIDTLQTIFLKAISSMQARIYLQFQPTNN